MNTAQLLKKEPSVVMTNLPPDGAGTNGMENADGPEGVLNAMFGQVNDPSQTNPPTGDDAQSDTNAPGSDGLQAPGRPGSRSEYDGRQSRQRRFGRPDAQRSTSATDAGALAAVSGTNAPSKTDYAYFRMIVDRNIFNPNRRPFRPGPIRDTAPIRPSSDYVSLVGIMSYREGDFAFFTGNLSRYEKSAQLGDVIATYKIVGINVSSNSVQLEGGTNRMELQVGMSMRRDEEGLWHASRTAAMFAAYNSTPAPGSDSTTRPGAAVGGTASSAASADDNEVIKRLMQRREQQ